MDAWPAVSEGVPSSVVGEEEGVGGVEGRGHDSDRFRPRLAMREPRRGVVVVGADPMVGRLCTPLRELRSRAGDEELARERVLLAARSDCLRSFCGGLLVLLLSIPSSEPFRDSFASAIPAATRTRPAGVLHKPADEDLTK